MPGELIDRFDRIRRDTPDRALVHLPSGKESVTAAALWESALRQRDALMGLGIYATINRFAGLIGKDPAVEEVRVVKLPLNVNPKQALSGNTLDNPEQTASSTADFRLLVLLKPDA